MECKMSAKNKSFIILIKKLNKSNTNMTEALI